MVLQRLKILASIAVFVIAVSTGCAKKTAKVTPPPPPSPPPAAPTATLAANPTVIQTGQQTTLTWQTSNANSITIAGLGTLTASGSRSVMPNASTTYTLVAKGPGGSADASARVTVNVPVAQATPAPSDQDLFAQHIKDVFFDFNKSNIRPDEVGATQANASFLGEHPSIKILIEGHCDDRGSEEYNLALGTSRAESVKQTLQQQGVASSRIQTISYGKEKPFCTEDNEQCWQENRVDHFVFQQ